MFNERLQILVTADQRRRLEAEARRRRTSIGSVIRDAIDSQIGVATRKRRIQAVQGIRDAPAGRFIGPAELDRLAESEHDQPPEPATVEAGDAEPATRPGHGGPG